MLMSGKPATPAYSGWLTSGAQRCSRSMAHLACCDCSACAGTPNLPEMF